MHVNKASELVIVTSDDDSSSDDRVFAQTKRFRNALSNRSMFPKGQKSTQKKERSVKTKPPITYTTSEESCSPKEPTEINKKRHDSPTYEPLFKFLPDDKKTCTKSDLFSNALSVTYATSDEDDASDDSEKKGRAGLKSGSFKNQAYEEPQVKIQHSFEIEGIKVEMPVKPYPCQRDVISAVKISVMD